MKLIPLPAFVHGVPAALCTNQQIFDTCINALIAQGSQASENGTCSYRTSLGLACAVGQLIPDSRYLETIENNVPRIEDFGTLTTGSVTADQFLKKLQVLHDEQLLNQPASWLIPITRFAKAHNLHTRNIQL